MGAACFLFSVCLRCAVTTRRLWRRLCDRAKRGSLAITSTLCTKIVVFPPPKGRGGVLKRGGVPKHPPTFLSFSTFFLLLVEVLPKKEFALLDCAMYVCLQRFVLAYVFFSAKCRELVGLGLFHLARYRPKGFIVVPSLGFRF